MFTKNNYKQNIKLSYLQEDCDEPALIDKIILYNFRIDDIDDLWRLQDADVLNNRVPETCLSITKSGEFFGNICIPQEKGVFDHFEYRLCPSGHIYCRLELSVCCGDASKDNLKCMTIKEVWQKIYAAKDLLLTKYGIHINAYSMKIWSIEINKTIKLENPYREYKHVINAISMLLPKRLRLNKYSEDGSTCSEKYDLEKNTESIRRYSSKKPDGQGFRIKMYDKSKQLKEKKDRDVNTNFFRFEIELCPSDKVAKSLGTGLVFRLSDETINAYYSEFIVNNVVRPKETYEEKQHKKIAAFLKKHYPKLKPKQLVDRLYDDLLATASDSGISVLFNFDVESLIKCMPKSFYKAKKQKRYYMKKVIEEKGIENLDYPEKYSIYLYDEIINKLK